MKKNLLILLLAVSWVAVACSEKPDKPDLGPGDGDYTTSVAGFPEWQDIKLDERRLTAENHPRLFLTDADMKDLKTQVQRGINGNIARLSANAVAAAVTMARIDRPLEYELDASGTRILLVSRKAVHRIGTLAYAYRLTGEKVYLEKAEWNMKVLCEFENWHDEHFLDPAEMALAIALGYDWLYNDLSDEVKELAADRLRRYAMEPGLAKDIFHRTGNWNQVCNGGLVCAALAVYETCPEVADEVLRKALASNAKEVKAIYAPDGAFPEGPGYWEYGTCYQGIMNVALETALGSDFELSTIQGFRPTGWFYVFDRGNSGKRFNYSDSGDEIVPSFGLWYLAYRFNEPAYLYQDKAFLDDDTYMHEYYTFFATTCAYKMGLAQVTPPTGRLYKAAGQNPLLMCKTGWESGDLYLALKGGTAGMSHAHMDVGEVVFDAYGTRWFKDFVYSTNYTEMESIFSGMGLDPTSYGAWHQESWRWKCFQYQPQQHSTITVNGNAHDIYGYAEIVESYDDAEKLGGKVDLTSTLGKDLKSACRTAVIRDGSYLEITDELEAPADAPAHIRWTCASDAKPSIVSDGIELNDGTTKMKLVTDAESAVYKTWSVDPDDYQPVVVPGQDPLEGYLCGFEFDIAAGSKITITTTLKK